MHENVLIAARYDFNDLEHIFPKSSEFPCSETSMLGIRGLAVGRGGERSMWDGRVKRAAK
jgi:hypothetical protein